MSLSKRNALVTGSTSGIGLAIARALAKDGANVVINGMGEAAAIETERARIEKDFGVEAFYDGADMTRPAEIAAMVENAQERLGSLDILVNNAGIQFVSPIEDFPVEKWDAIIAINLSAAFHAIRAAVPGMKAARWGRIVSTASAHSLVASPFKSAYVAAKHGIAGLTKTVALELATSGVTANCISPGYVWTPLVEKQIPDTMKARKWGRIVSTASAHSLVASPFKSAYVSAKHGVAGLTKTVALELATSGVTANCVSPGYVWTPLVENQIPDTMKARGLTRDQVINDVMLASQPTKQFVTPDQVAALVLYLCSDNATQITGANLSIDGGWTAA